MVRFPGRPGQITAVGRTRVSFRWPSEDNNNDGVPPSLSEMAAFEISRWCRAFYTLFGHNAGGQDDEEFEGFVDADLLESKMALERTMQELGGGYEHWADVLDEVNRIAPQTLPLETKSRRTSSNQTKQTNESGASNGRTRMTRPITMRVRPGMRDVVQRSYAEMNKHGFDADDGDDNTLSSPDTRTTVVNDVNETRNVEETAATVNLSHPAEHISSLRLPCQVDETPKLVDDVRSTCVVQSAVNSMDLNGHDVCRPTPFQPLVLNSTSSSLNNLVQVSNGNSLPPPPPPPLPLPVQRKTFMLPEKSVRSSRIIFPKKRNMEDFEFSDVITTADEKRTKVHKAHGRIGVKIPQVALSESDCIDEPAFWSKLSEKHGLDCGERMREEISRYTERMARTAVHRKGISPQRAGSSSSPSSSSSSSSVAAAAMTMTTMNVSHSPRTSRSANGSDTGSPVTSPAEIAGSMACGTGKPNADKVAAKIQQILRSQWEGRLDMPKRKRGRPKKIRITSSPSAGVRAEAEQRRVSARLRTKTILRKARLKLNKRTLMKLRQPANLRRLSEQCRAEQDKVSAPFRLLKFPTVQLKAIDSLSATVHLPSKPSSSTSSASASSSSTSLDVSTRSSSISSPFGQRGALCSGATVWPTHTFGDITQHPNCGLEDSFRLSSWTESNGGSRWIKDNSIFSKLTLPPAITVKSLPLINPYITISKLDTSKILNNTVIVKSDLNSFHDAKSEDKTCPGKAVEPMENEKHDGPTVEEEVIETIVCRPPAPGFEPAIETKDVVPVLEYSFENRVPTVSSEPIKRSRGRKAHPLWSRARRPSGPRVKHVCRHASVVLGLPIATFPALESSSSSSCSSTPRKESKAGLFFPGILSKLKNKCTLNNGKNPKIESIRPKKSRSIARRNTRCKKCVGCLMPDCEKCVYCLDRSKYGGTNKLKQACKFRVCIERPKIINKKKRKKLANIEENVTQEKHTAHASSHVPETGSAEVARRSKSKITAVNAVVRRLLKKTKAVSQKKEKVATPSIKEPAKPFGNKKVIEKSNGDCDISVQTSPRDPSLVDVTFWEDYDLAQVWDEGMPAISSTIPVLRASCFLCGSAGLEELIYCILCCEPFHPFCLDSSDIPCDGNFDNWCCRRCQYCQVCGQRDSLLKCFECHNTYHAACLGDNYPTRPSKKKKIWMCTKCVKCKSCGATSPGKSAAAHWMCDFSLCYDCGKLFDKGNFCPMCKRCYEDDDDQSKMVLCSKCDCWVHAKCANMTDEEYQVLTFLPDSEVVYSCAVCSPDKAHSWMSIVMAELYAGFSKILDTLNNSKHAKFLRTKEIFSEKRSVRIRISPLQQSVIQDLNDTSKTKYSESNFLPKSLTEPNDLDETKKLTSVVPVSKRLRELLSVDETSGNYRLENREPLPALHVDIPVDIKSSPLSLTTGNRLNVAFVDGPPSDLHALIQKVDDKKYSSVVQFCEDIVRVVRFCGSLTRSTTKPVRDLFNTTLEKTFPWFQWSESVLWGDERKNLLPDAVMPPNMDHSYAQYLCRSVNGETMPQPSIYRQEQLLCSSEPPNGLCADALLLKLKAESCLDSRLCVLCGVQGDSNSEVNGRLLYCGQDDWVHVNCALWSAEVFEEVDGSLQRVHSAILRGNKMKCDACDRPGATVGCCCQGCRVNYHFACAQRDGAVFQEDKTVYCRLHVHLATGKHISGSDFQVRHIMYVDLDALHPKWTKKTWLFGLHPSSITILVGSMTVESLGEVTGVSDHVEAIIPINFCCTRLYWSTKNPRQRVIYTCRTVLDNSDPEPIMEPKADENHTIEHITVAGREMTEIFCSSPCLIQSALKNHPFTPDGVTNDGDDVEELTVIMCQDELERCLPIEMLSDFCQDCMKESTIGVDNCATDEAPTELMVDRLLKERNVISLIDPPPPPSVAALQNAVDVDATAAATESEIVTVAESLDFHEDDINKADHLLNDVSSIQNCDAIAAVHKEVSANGSSTNIESFAEALQELVCNVLHSGQHKLNDTEKMLSGKASGKGKEMIGANQKKTKVTADVTSSKTANAENHNGVSHWNGSLLRLQQFLSDKRGGQNQNNNNNDCHKKSATKSNGKSSCDVRLPKVLLQCRKCNEAVKSANSNSNKMVGSPRDLLSLNGTRMSTTVSKRSKNGCMRALSSSVPAIICDGSSSGSASMMPSELASPWFQLGAHDNGGDDSDVDEEHIQNVENRDYVSLALSRACCNILCGGDSLDRRTSIVTTVLNEKKIDPIGGTDSQSTHMKPSTTALAERITSSMTCNGGSQSNVPFLETPPPGGGSQANHQSDGSDDTNKDSDVARSEKNTAADAASRRSVRGNPLRCPKCKRIYRTAESFQRHYQTCDFEVDSSSSSEDEEAIASPPTTATVTVNPLDETRGSKSDTTLVCVSQVLVSNKVEKSHSESVASSSNNSSGPPIIHNEPSSMSLKSRVPNQSTMGPLTPTKNSAKSICLRHPKRILPKTSASGCQQQQLLQQQQQQQAQQRMAAPSNLSRTIDRVVRMVSPLTQAAAAAAMTTQPIPSYVPQHQQHHVIQVQGRTFMIPICHVPAQSQLQHQQAQQAHDVQSYAEQLSYLGSLHLSSQGQLTSVSLNVPVSQFTLPAVGGPATFYQHQQQQQQPQHTHLVQPAVHLSTAAATVDVPCNQQQMLIAPHLQHQVALHNYSLTQQSIIQQQQQQQNENWVMRVDMPNQFSALQSVQPDNADSEQHETPLTCSIASQTQLSPPPPPQVQQQQQQQFPPNEITETPINSLEACIDRALIVSDIEALLPLETREYREAETSTDFDVLCDPSLPTTDGSEEVSTTLLLDEKTCCSVQAEETVRTLTSVESTTQTTSEDNDGLDDNGDDHQQQHAESRVTDGSVDETSEFADLLKKVSQQIANLASSKGRMACAILPARPSCSSNSRRSPVNANLSMSDSLIADSTNRVHDDVRVEPYAATVEVEQRSSSSDSRTLLSSCDATPPTPAIRDSRLSRTEFVLPERRDNPGGSGPRIAFEITSDDGFHIRSGSVDEAWRTVAERVQEVRAASQMRHMSTEGVSGLKMFGVTNRAVRYVLEQLPGTEQCRKFQFIYHHKDTADEAYENKTGCARSEVFKSRKEHDMFNFLASRHRLPPEYTPSIDEEEMQFKSSRRATSLELPMAMRFRHIGRTAHEAVGAYRSKIHGRGLFCKRNIDAGEMVIEYAGEVIRSILTDKREKYYDAKGIGCYMFKIDDNEVVDATMHGNAARFINHSCEPNCYSKVISVDGKKHIVIFALRRIMSGEELTYDYKFPIEDDKIPCTCGSRKCRRYLN